MRLFDTAYLRRTAKFAGITAGLELASLVPGWARPRRVAGRGVILTLHHVRPVETDAFSPNEFLSITPEFLDNAIATALDCGLVPVRLEDLPERLACEKDRNAYLAVTLDDGYRDNAEFAAPVFAKHKVPYTIFLASGFIERSHAPWWETAERLIRQNDRFTFDFGVGPEALIAEGVDEKMALFDRFTAFVKKLEEDTAVERINDCARRHGIEPRDLVESLVMGPEEVRALSASDELVSFGAHSVSHPNLKRVSEARLRKEIVESGRAVTAYAGKTPTAFAYPYGWTYAVGPREMKAVADAGFKLAVTTQPGVLGTPQVTPLHALKRISLNGYYQKARYVRALVSGMPFLLRR